LKPPLNEQAKNHQDTRSSFPDFLKNAQK